MERKQLIGYFRLCYLNVNDCPAALGKKAPQVLEIGEKQL